MTSSRKGRFERTGCNRHKGVCLFVIRCLALPQGNRYDNRIYVAHIGDNQLKWEHSVSLDFSAWKVPRILSEIVLNPSMNGPLASSITFMLPAYNSFSSESFLIYPAQLRRNIIKSFAFLGKQLSQITSSNCGEMKYRDGFGGYQDGVDSIEMEYNSRFESSESTFLSKRTRTLRLDSLEQCFQQPEQLEFIVLV